MKLTTKTGLLLSFAAGILLTCRPAPATGGPAGALRVFDLDNQSVDPFQAPPDTRAIVFLFTSTDCPIANRYAPEITRLHETFAGKGVVFRLVYPNPSESAAAIRDHLRAFGYPMPALRDPEHDLVKVAQATVSPEAAVFDRAGRLVYRGRLDDRYVELGVDRQVPTRRDLENALAATLAGKPVRARITRAVGCLLADMRP